MSKRILTPLEVSALKQDLEKVAPDDIENLIATVEDAWAVRDSHQRLIDDIWDKFGEMSRLIRGRMRQK